MSQLQFKQITFTNEDARGSAANKNLLGRNTDYRIFRYPLDIGSYERGHYMVIHINEQVKTRFGESRDSNGNAIPSVANPNAFQDPTRNPTGAGQSIGNAIEGAITGWEYLKGTIGDGVSAVAVPTPNIQESDFGPASQAFGGAIAGATKIVEGYAERMRSADFRTNFARTIQRTKDSIVLYMPDTMAFTNNQGYNEFNIGTDARILNAIGDTAGAMKRASDSGMSASQVGEAAGRVLAPYLAAVLAEKNDLTRVAFAAVTGTVLNPMIELVYSTPQLRNFRFDFMLYPRSQKEAVEINKILDCLKFHQAPEIATEGAGAFLIPPSEFNIEFYYNGEINPNIERISTCVLESIDYDYAPNGFSAYETESSSPTSGGTGMPVAIRLSLAFKETEYKTKSNYSNYANIRGETAISPAINTQVPYDAFGEAVSVGLNIGQGSSGNYDSDLPFVKNNFEFGE